MSSHTGEDGSLRWIVGSNGDYYVTAGKTGYLDTTQMYSLACTLDKCEVLYISFSNTIIDIRSVELFGSCIWSNPDVKMLRSLSLCPTITTPKHRLLALLWSFSSFHRFLAHRFFFWINRKLMQRY